MSKLVNSLRKVLLLNAVLLMILALAACTLTRSRSVPNSFDTPKVTPTLVMGGGAAGAISAIATNASVPVGTLVGGLAGSVVGLYADSAPNLIAKLRGQGVQVVQLGDNLTLILPTDNCFDLGSPDIEGSCVPILLNVAALLKRYDNVPISVQAHTDNVWGADQAEFISRAQAESIVGFLWAHGIPHEHVFAKGCGDDCPIGQNDTVLGSAMNRRIEIALREE